MHVVCDGGKLEDLKRLLRNGEMSIRDQCATPIFHNAIKSNKCHSESCLNSSFNQLHDVYFVFAG